MTGAARKPGVPAALAAWGLPDHAELPTSALDTGEWASLLREVKEQRIEGLLAAAVHDGALVVTDPQLEETRQAGRGRASVDLRLERELLAAAAVLDAADVSYRVLKGLAWAHTAYPDPSWRGSGDVDLLVAAGDWYRAITALEAVGACRPVPEVRPGFDSRFGKEATLLTASGWEIDLHRTLVVGPFGLWIDPESLFERKATANVGGVELPVLDAEAGFLHACYNAALADDPPRLIALRDVCQLALAADLSPDAVWELARRWRGEAVVGRALGLAEAILAAGMSIQGVVTRFAGRRASGWERALVASYRGPARGYTSQLAAVVALEGTLERIAYLRALARPQRSYLAARGASPLAHLARAPRKMWSHR